MTREDVIEKIKTIVADCFPDLEGLELKEDTVINTDTGIDSMGFVLIICKLEAAFNVRIPERQWKKLATVSDVADAIISRLPK